MKIASRLPSSPNRNSRISLANKTTRCMFLVRNPWKRGTFCCQFRDKKYTSCNLQKLLWATVNSSLLRRMKKSTEPKLNPKASFYPRLRLSWTLALRIINPTGARDVCKYWETEKGPPREQETYMSFAFLSLEITPISLFIYKMMAGPRIRRKP